MYSGLEHSVNREVDLGEDGFVRDGRDVIFEAALEGGFEGFVVEEGFAAEFGEEGFDFAGGEEIGNGGAEIGEGGLVELQAVIFCDGLEELETFFGSGGGEERNFEIDAAGAFEVDFDEVRAAGGENPDDAAAVFLVAHFLGEHGVDAAGDGGFAAAGIAAAERLIGFIDEDVAFADGFDGAEDFFEIALGAAIPFVAEIFQDDDGDVRFAGEAADEKRFAGADRAAEEIAHGNEIDLLLAPESDVLAEMFLERFLALDLIEVKAGRENFDEVRTFALDELGLGAGEVFVVERFALMFAEFEEIDDAVQGRAGELTAGVREFVFEFGKRRATRRNERGVVRYRRARAGEY